MNPLSALYGAAVRSRNELYDRQVIAIQRLRGPVVSVGNISVGGSGKTPFVILLGELLNTRGVAFDVLMRGYGRETRGVAVVDPAGSPAHYGDEPLLIASKLQVPVIVGEDRHKAGRLAESKFGLRMHLLDDGFQHRRLARDFDIVLVSSADAHDALLPVGKLREPIPSLQRADAIVLTNQASGDGLPIRNQLLWRVNRGIVAPAIEGPAIAFCGIARPENFFADLRAAGITLATTRGFRDHHAYNDHDVRELLRLRRQNGGAPFIVTEKDAINLGEKLKQLQPAFVAPLRLELQGPEAALDAMLAKVAERWRGAA